MARVQIAINSEKCKLPMECRKCVAICPQCVYKVHLIRIDKGKKMPLDAWGLAMWFPDQCRGCLECVRVCPEKALELVSPCQFECPAHVDIPSYISLLGEGKIDEAINVHRNRNPFVAVCARVCPHPCETMCERKKMDNPVAVRALKRYMADNAKGKSIKPVSNEDPRNKNKKVAVVGAGPAGLSCAYFLKRLGYSVTVFEKADKPGGMLTSMIPLHRLPEDIVNEEINFILDLGIDLKLNTTVGKDVTIDSLRKQGYEAFFLGVGAQAPVSLGNLPGADVDGVIDALEFLKSCRSGKTPKLGKNVAIIGGGNAAIDAARTALRQGANVTVVYRRNREEMPAIDAEVEEAVKEGVQFRFLARPKKIEGKNGKVESLVCEEMVMKGYDLKARQKSVAIEGKEFTIKADTIITAIGQKLDADEILKEAGIGLSYEGFLFVDKYTLATNIPNIFAGGDAVTGPATVAEAIGKGEQAARSIDKCLSKDLTAEEQKTRYPWLEPYDNSISFNLKALPASYTRQDSPLIPVSERIAGNGSKEVEITISKEEVTKECARCLRCDYIVESKKQEISKASASAR